MKIQDRQEEQSASTGAAAGATESNAHFNAVGMAYGRFIYRLRWIIPIIWIAGLAVSIPFVLTLSAKLQSGNETPKNTQSAQVSDLLTSTFHQPQSQVLAVFQSPDTLVTDPAYQQELAGFISRARGFSHVVAVQPEAPAADGRTTFVVVGFDQNTDATVKLLPDFRKLVPQGTTAGPATVQLTGNPAVSQDLTQTVSTDLERSEAASLPISLIVLLIVFGTLVAAAMPLALALFAVPVALALIALVNVFTPLNIFVLNIATIIGLGISIDYSLFIIRRYREELALGVTKAEAIGRTIATAGEAILFSGITVMIGFAGLFLLHSSTMTAIGIGGALTVGCSVLAALTLLPAILSLLGERVNALRVPVLGRLTLPHPEEATKRGFWHGLAEAEMRAPVAFIVAVLAVLALLAWPALNLNIGSSGVGSLPKQSESRQALETLSARYPTFGANSITLIARATDGSNILTANNVANVASLSQWIAGQGHVTSVISLTQFPATPGQPAPTAQQLGLLYSTGAYQQNPALAQLVAATTAGNATIITATSDLQIDSAASKDLVTRLRADAAGQAGGMRILVGGTQAQSVDLNGVIYGNFPLAIGFILVTTYLLLLIMLRSVLLPLKAVLMTGLSISAAFGVMVFIFQQGHLGNLLNFTSNGFIDNTIPILMFCILFGLSMDYEVFLVSRMREEWLTSRDNRTAVARGVEKTGGVITSAALLFIIISGSFAFTRISETQEIGVGMAVAVFVDAALVRTLLVPAVMRLLGRANWWFPGRQSRAG